MIWFIKVASAVIWYSGFCYDVVCGWSVDRCGLSLLCLF